MKVIERLEDEVTYEVWRSHPRLRDVKLAGNMDARTSLKHLRFLEKGNHSLPKMTFYRVRVTARRERVE